jgi:hypothetical protein
MIWSLEKRILVLESMIHSTLKLLQTKSFKEVLLTISFCSLGKTTKLDHLLLRYPLDYQLPKRELLKRLGQESISTQSTKSILLFRQQLTNSPRTSILEPSNDSRPTRKRCRNQDLVTTTRLTNGIREHTTSSS